MINIPNTSHLEYQIFIKGKINKTNKEIIKKLTRLTLKQEKITNNNLIIEFLICSKQEMSKYSQQYLNKDHATDIISIQGENNKTNIQNNKTILGSIIICPQIIKEQQINPQKHFYHLIIHGILHLLGYNHEKEEEIIKMQNKEKHILSKLSITYY